jgi:hypothetical protein
VMPGPAADWPCLRCSPAADGMAGVAFVGSNAGVELGPAEQRLLPEMPLHAITSVHGEPGLRER